MAIQLSGSAQTELHKLNRGLAEYARLSGKAAEEVLDKKGRDLGIQLYRGFRARRWGAGRKTRGPGGIAFREAEERFRQGRGTRVRPRIKREARAARGTISIRRPDGSIYRETYWHRAVRQELHTRQRGIGALAASFLWIRRARRFSKSQGKYVALRTRQFVRNKTGRPIGYVDRGPGFFRIVGSQEGLGIVANRYGIHTRAIAAVNRDMAPYLARKQLQEVQRAFRRVNLATLAT